MKRLALLAALAALALPSMSATLFTSPNKNGGMIRLTDRDDTLCRAYESTAYSVTTTGEATFGCWKYDAADNMVFIRWRTGLDYALPLSIFDMAPAGEENLKALEARKKSGGH